ncbi:uncharacterized protein LOC143701533 isoform X2 [Siphateles boraxobius]|uniref:uncharacterized protein LOC143701533 isoform X2 n=1 Tax=Siphateles boraxobius TaxID=180520 RepID=UPI004062A802
MLSRNLVIASVAVVFLASTISTAPVEDKEPEENDFEAEEGEEELSEEEEDDDDSKGQHMKGAGSQQATAAPKGLGMTPGSGVSGESPNGQKLNGGAQTGQVSSSSTSAASDGANGSNGRDGYSRPPGSSSHGASYDGQEGSKSEIVPSGVGPGGTGANGGSGSKVPGTDGGVHSVSISVVPSGQGSSGHIAAGHGSTMSSSHTFGRPSAGQTSGGVAVVSSEVHSQPAGSEGFAPQYENGETAHDGSQIESPEIPEIESNGNGHKHLLNGGETGFTGLDHFMPGTSQIQGTGGFDSLGTSPHLEITGIIDQSSHDILVGLMGGIGESFGPDTQTDGLDHMGLAFQVDSAAAGLSPGHPSSGGPVLDAPPDSAGPDYVSADSGNGDYTHSISTSDNGAQSKSPPDTTDSSVVFDTMSHPGHSFIDYSEGADHNAADSPDTNGNGNGRHKPVVDIQKGDPPAVHLDISGTGLHDAATEMHHTAGDQHAVSSHPDAVGALDLVDHTLSPYADTTGREGVTGGSAQTDMAGVAGDPMTEGQAQTDVTGQGHLAVTDGMPNYTADSVHATGTGFTDASETHSSMVQTDLPVTGDPFTGVSSQTDAMGTGQPGATEQTQPAVSAGEQYHTSGQGPEGAENVELEDTC